MVKIKEYKKDGDTFYEFQVYVGIDPITGDQIQTRRRGFTTRKKAELELAQIMLDIEDGTFKMRETPKKFEEIVELWLPYYKTTVQEVTYIGTLSYLKLYILPEFKGKKIDKIDVTLCQKIVNKWAEEKPNTFKKYKFYASKIFNYAVNIGVINDNPMKKILTPKVSGTKKKIGFFEADELKQFLSYVEALDPNKLYTFFRLLAYSGMRKGEAYALTWDDIDFEKNKISITKSLSRGENKTVYVSPPKNPTSVRIISMDKSTMNILKRWKNTQKQLLMMLGHPTSKKDQILFSTDKNEYYKPTIDANWLRNIYKQEIVPTDFKRISTHGLRHTHASLLFEAGASFKAVQERLGHADIATTMNIYTHVTKKVSDGTGDLFANFVG
ncbi:tyrosine-type recombinase/integrase [Enterococcus sp. AZ072]|uniref:site-specific integrase n=1 Tax=unclassified Enterococcus TaxID=2608891 RepID=UPI003D2DBCE6